MSFQKTTPGWELGKWLVICDRCGFKRTNTEVAKEPWTNLIVCKDTCWETRHPQTFVRPRPDAQAVPWTSPEPTDVLVDVTYEDTGADDIPSGTFNTTDTINES
jgi:hypothetical protein